MFNLINYNISCILFLLLLMEIIFADGWIFESQEGSHRHYSHPTKKGKVTIPFHCKDIPNETENSILKQAGLK